MVKVERLAAINGGDTVEVEYLGHLMWFTITDLRVTTDDLEIIFKEAGLDEAFLPRKINARDAFRRATKDAEFKREQCGENTYRNLLVREVAMDSERLVRQLVRETVDGQNVRLDYVPVAQLEIVGEDLLVTPLRARLMPEESAALERLPEMFDEALHCHDGQRIRHLVKNILAGCAPVSVRPSGGVYFVPQKYSGTVESLKILAKELSVFGVTNGKTRMWSVPVIDAREHREMVEESLEEQVVAGSRALIKEMKDIMVSGRKVTDRLAQGYAGKVRQLKDMVAEYEEMLEFQATLARETLELATRQAMEFLTKVEIEG